MTVEPAHSAGSAPRDSGHRPVRLILLIATLVPIAAVVSIPTTLHPTQRLTASTPCDLVLFEALNSDNPTDSLAPTDTLHASAVVYEQRFLAIPWGPVFDVAITVTDKYGRPKRLTGDDDLIVREYLSHALASSWRLELVRLIEMGGGRHAETSTITGVRRKLLLSLCVSVPGGLCAIGVYSVYTGRGRRRRLALGNCEKCGYDRSGISESAPCPECGLAPSEDR